MSRFERSATQSSGSGESRMVQQSLPESSSRLDPDEFFLGEETGLPLIPCLDCGLATVVERRSAKDTTKNHPRVYFKCPLNVNGFPKLCGFKKFQREYLDKLKELGIVRIRTSPTLEIVDEASEGEDATSGYTERGMEVEAKKDVEESKLDAKMEDLLWKFKGGDAISGYAEREMKVEAKKNVEESKLDAKMEDLLWKFNLLMFVFAVLLGGVFLYLAVALK